MAQLLWFFMSIHSTQHNNSTDFIDNAKTAIATEIDALHILINQIDDRFSQACQTILACRGRVVVTGMGKSGHIGRKIAATLASTGTPAFFVHPAEAGHGDLGMLVAGDVLIAISNSGQSDEIALLLPVVKHLNIPLISISRTDKGILPKNADIALTLGESREACPLGLAPTSSTTATLALGDALAVALLYARGFTQSDFALSHPAGALGKRLLTLSKHIMHTDNLPIVSTRHQLSQTLPIMTGGRLGLAVVVESDKVVGVFTDGDLRRYLAHSIDLSITMDNIMSRHPKTASPDSKAIQALEQMKNWQINQLLITQDDKLVGVLSLQDLIGAGITL